MMDLLLGVYADKNRNGKQKEWETKVGCAESEKCAFLFSGCAVLPKGETCLFSVMRSQEAALASVWGAVTLSSRLL